MANLSYTEKRNLEEFLDMVAGYVCNFTDRTFREFVFDSTGLDINDVAIGGQGSKARRLRHFWTTQSRRINLRQQGSQAHVRPLGTPT